MEELFLGTFLSYNKLDIVDQKNVIVSVLIAEFSRRVVVFASDGVDQIIGKT